MTAPEALVEIESMFIGEYKPAMRSRIQDYLEKVIGLNGLIFGDGMVEAISRFHKSIHPPMLADVRDLYDTALDVSTEIRNAMPPTDVKRIGELTVAYGEVVECDHCHKVQVNTEGRCQRCEQPLRKLTEEEHRLAEETEKQAVEAIARLKASLKERSKIMPPPEQKKGSSDEEPWLRR